MRWQSTWDYDNLSLTYRLYRDQGTTPIYTTTVDSTFWNEPWLGYMDTGLTPGSQHTYRLTVTDPNGNVTSPAASSAVTVSATTPDTTTYDADVTGDGATQYWHLAEPAGSAGYSSIGWDDLAFGTGVTRGVAGPTAGRNATTLDGTANSPGVVTPTYRYGPDAVTLEGWFKTSTTSGGVLMDFGDTQKGLGSRSDRVLYMSNSGNLAFANHTNTGSTATLITPGAYNDGAWHHVAATFSPSAGTALYVDGSVVSSDPTDTTSYPFEGYWRVGGDTVPPGGPTPSSNYFAGTLGDLAIYPTALAESAVQQHYADSGVTAPAPPTPTNAPPTASFTVNCSNLNCAFNASGSHDNDGTLTSYGWDFGDGTSGSGVAPSHTFAAGANSVTLTVTDNSGNTATQTRVVPLPNFASDAFNRNTSSGWVAPTSAVPGQRRVPPP